MQDGLDREESRRRYGLFVDEVFRRAGSPMAVAVELKKMGFAAPDGSTYSERTMRAWRGMQHQMTPDVMFGLAARFKISLDELALGEQLEGKLADRVSEQGGQVLRNSRDIAWLKDRFIQLAVRLSHDDLLGPMPSEEAAEQQQAEEA